jgi:hypothetical protein
MTTHASSGLNSSDPQSLGEMYILKALDAVAGRAIAESALIRDALSLWEADRGRGSEHGLRGGLDRLLERSIVGREEHPIELGTATFIRLLHGEQS